MWTFLFVAVCMFFGALLLITLLLTIPPMLFCIPYSIWKSEHGREGLPVRKLKQFAHIWHEAANAARVYRSWITKAPHGIKYFSTFE